MFFILTGNTVLHYGHAFGIDKGKRAGERHRESILSSKVCYLLSSEYFVFLKVKGYEYVETHEGSNERQQKEIDG